MPSLTQWLRESRSVRPIDDDLDSTPKPKKLALRLVGDTERRPERRRLPTEAELESPYRETSAEAERVDPLVTLRETFQDEVCELLDLMSNCTNRTDFKEVIRLRMCWTSKKPGFPGLKERLEKWFGDHGISGVREYIEDNIQTDARWKWFKNHVLPRYRKACTKRGKRLRQRANKKDHKKRVAKETPEAHLEKLVAWSASNKTNYRKRLTTETRKEHEAKLAKRRKRYAKKHPKKSPV